MLSTNDMMEELSYVYVHAIASKASFACERVFKDRDSIDVTIRRKGKLAKNSLIKSPALDLQLKATTEPEIRNKLVIYDLKMKTTMSCVYGPHTHACSSHVGVVIGTVYGALQKLRMRRRVESRSHRRSSFAPNNCNN